MKLKILLLILFVTANSWGQTTIFSENIGIPSGTTSIVTYSGGVAPATFQNIASLTYDKGAQTNPADIRITSPSNTYAGASGNGNVFLTNTSGAYGFSIENINASAYTSLTLDYGYRKEAAGSHAAFSVDYWDGSAWQTLANTSATLFNEATGAATGWYAAKTLNLPVGAQIGSLKIRFVKTGTASIRIDDIILKGILGVGCTPSVTTNASNQTIIENNNATFTLVTNNVISYQWQVSTDGTTYTNLTDTGTYSGSTTTSLTLTSVPITMSGYYYRCQLTPNTPCSAITSNPVTLTVNGTSCLTEGFSGGTTPPASWAFTNIGATYITAGNYGAASPSLNMGSLGTTGDAVIETPTVANIQQLSFWMKGQGTTGGSSYLLVEGFNGTSWVTIDNISSIVSNTVYIKTYNSITIPVLPQNIQKVRFTYVKLPAASGGNISFDDVAFNCSTCPSSTTWDGTTWSNGTPNSSTTAVINANYSTPNSIDACSIVVNPGKTLKINSSDYLKVQNNLIINGNLILYNDASLIQVNNTTNKGNITYNRTASGLNGYDYVYWSSPVFSNGSNGQQLDNIYTSPTQGPKFKWNTTATNANSTQGTWDWATGDYMLPGKGYIVRASNAYSSTGNTINAVFTGVANNGDISIKVTRGSNSSSFDDNWNLLGNPYPSAINGLAFLANNSNPGQTLPLIGSLYLWYHGNAPTSNTNPFYQSFAYNYFNDYNVINYTGSTVPSSSEIVKANQAFFVKRVDGNQDLTGVDVTFTNAMRLDSSNSNLPFNNSGFYKNNNSASTNGLDYMNLERNRIWVDLVNGSTLSSTTTLVGYIEGATNGLDNMFDATTNQSSFGIYSVVSDEKLITQGRALPFTQGDIVPLGITISTNGNYFIALKKVDGLFASNQPIYVEDKVLNVIFDISQLPYSFYSESGVFNNRFALRYSNTTLGQPSLDLLTNNVVAATNLGKLTISSSIEKLNNIQVFDVLGRQLLEAKNIESYSYVNASLIASQQALIVKITLESGVVVTKKIVL
jgi:hypothetical protein